MKSIKELVPLSALMLTLLFFVTSCNDNDEVPEPTPGEIQIQEVLKELDKVEGVDEFLEALKQASTSIAVNLEEDKLTVFAAKNYNQTRSSDETLKRHIAKGAKDILNFSADTLTLETLSGENLYVTKTEEEILVNGIPLAKDSCINAGSSYIYVVNNTLPPTESFVESLKEVVFNVQECNLAWSPDSTAASFPSEKALIKIYLKEGDNYVDVDSIVTDKDGLAVYKHRYTEDLYYTVRNGYLRTNHGGYLPIGVLTSQTEVDELKNSVSYKTGTPLDYLRLGAVILADLNGDTVIDADDELTSEFFPVDQQKEIVVYLGAGYLDWEPTDLEKLDMARSKLNSFFRSFREGYFRTDKALITPTVTYPKLADLKDHEAMWSNGYLFIPDYFYTRSTLNFNPALKEKWNTYKCDAEFAYIYMTLVNYFGDVPIFNTLDPTIFVRNTKQEVADYIESFMKDVAPQNANAIKALLARFYANEQKYDKVQQYADEIINSGTYALVEKPLSTASNDEVILGGYMINDSVIPHPIRYREVVLLSAEAAYKQGDQGKALNTINQVRAINKQEPFTSLTDSTIRSVWKQEFSNQGMDYMLINRWGRLEEELGKYGAQSYNNVLPIPQDEVNYYGLSQNTGY